MSSPASPARPAPGGGGLFESIGDATRLLARSLAQARHARPFLRTVLGEVSVVAVASVLALAAAAFLAGAGCGVESNALARQLGARSAAGGLSALCTLREIVPYVFGYVLALAVGSELVVDLAAHEGREDPAPAAGLRALAVLLIAPFAYLLTLNLADNAMVLVGVSRFAEVTGGSFFGTRLAFQDALDLLYSAIKATSMTVFVVGAALLFGARAQAGAEGAGYAAARYGLVALVGVTLLGTFWTLVFWGGNGRIEVG